MHITDMHAYLFSLMKPLSPQCSPQLHNKNP